MFGSVGGGEILVLLVLALLLFGPRRLPKIGRTVGAALSEFRRATTDFKMNLEREVDLTDVKAAGKEITGTLEEVKGVARGALDPLPARPRTVADDPLGRPGAAENAEATPKVTEAETTRKPRSAPRDPAGEGTDDRQP